MDYVKFEVPVGQIAVNRREIFGSNFHSINYWNHRKSCGCFRRRVYKQKEATKWWNLEVQTIFKGKKNCTTVNWEKTEPTNYPENRSIVVAGMG